MSSVMNTLTPKAAGLFAAVAYSTVSKANLSTSDYYKALQGQFLFESSAL